MTRFYSNETYVIATALIKYRDKYLIGKRSVNKKFGPNKYEFISGFIDEKKSAETIILRELQEETNLNGKIIDTSSPYTISDKEARWIIIPFLIEVDSENFTINYSDHSELFWVTKKELEKFSDLKEDIIQLKIKKLI